MERKPGISPAFTMVELVLAVLLSTMIMLALAAIYANSFKYYQTVVRGNVQQVGAVAAIQAISRDLEKTTYLYQPTAPCSQGNCVGSVPEFQYWLEGCTNYDPLSTNAGGLLSPTASMRIYNYCVDSSNNLWYSWIDYPAGSAGACNPPVSVTTCGTAPSGWNQVELAQNTTGSSYRSSECSSDPGQHFFCRPAFGNNVVEMDFIVSGSTVSTKINMAMPVLSPSP